MTETQPDQPQTGDAPATGWGVTLYMQVQDASTPAAAVEAFLQRTLRYGMRQFTYSVENRATGEVFFIDQGALYTQDEYLEHLTEPEASGDEGS